MFTPFGHLADDNPYDAYVPPSATLPDEPTPDLTPQRRQRDERESPAGTGLSRCGPERAPAGSPVSALPRFIDMTTSSALAAASTAATLPLALRPDSAGCLAAAAQLLLPHLEQGRRVDAPALRAAMEQAFGASDAVGAWDWKAGYDACEAATVLFLRKYGRALLRKAGSPAQALPMLEKVVGLLPTHTRRSAESEAHQQFSTPIPLGLAVATAAAITPADRVLEPSAGTGLLAILAELAGGSLVLNELAEARAALLSFLFPTIAVTRHDAAQIHDHLDPAIVPSVVVMNPPFSVMANVEGRMADAAFRHVASALARLAHGGRLVAITGANFAPDAPAWRDAFVRLQERGRIVFSAAIDGRVFAKHGTTFPTRLTVIDKLPADDPAAFPATPGVAPDVATLMAWIAEHIPSRLPVDPSVSVSAPLKTPRTVRGYSARAARSACRPASTAEPEGVELDYETLDWTPPQGSRLSDSIYEDYGLQSIHIRGAQDHPTQLVQSAAMASVAPPKPSYRPHLPANILSLLSDAQLETLIYAGEAHADYLAGAWTVDETHDVVTAAAEEATGAVRFRRGFMIGDGTGVGKGREAAGSHPRQLDAGPAQGGVDLQVRQADRGRPAGLVRSRHGAAAHYTAVPIPAGQADHASGGHPIHDLCHPTLRRSWRKAFPRQADRRMVGLRWQRKGRGRF